MSEHAKAIVDAILKNLRDRQGIGNQLEQIDPEIYTELRQSLMDNIDAILEPPERPTP